MASEARRYRYYSYGDTHSVTSTKRWTPQTYRYRYRPVPVRVRAAARARRRRADVLLWQPRHMASRCAITVPADPAELTGLPILPPADLIPWGPQHVTALHHEHRWQFSPANHSEDGWAAAVRASQFGNCSRLLLVEDDLTKAGLGFTAKIWQAALLIAMRDNRVLMEVRMVKQHYNASPGEDPRVAMRRSQYFERPRWCDREPFTLQCLYQPWTHCKPPPIGATIIRPGGRPLKTNKWPHNEPYVITGLGRIHRQGLFWYGARSSAQREAGRFLFRPRRWIQDVADCVTRDAGLTANGFVSMHIRHSVEKTAESQRLGVQLPSLEAYGVLSQALADDLGTRMVFVQTASPTALEHIVSVGRKHGLTLVYTNNSRSDNDAWGGWNAGAEMEQATVAAVNAHIGSRALASVSPILSLWTNFLWITYGLDVQSPARTTLCCDEGTRCSKMRVGSRTFDVFLQPSHHHANALGATRKVCREGTNK